MVSTDLFSGHADDYKRFRPTYPDSFFEWLASQSPACDVAWDCGTGNGQGACQLANYFDSVVATDVSAPQIEQATAHPRIEYRVATAENSALPENSVSVVSVFQALHWFANDDFFNEVKRVLKPGGLLVVVGYNTAITGIDIVDKTYKELYFNYFWEKECWAKERQLLNDDYNTVLFPFSKEIKAPNFFIQMSWTYQDYLSYISTCSASKAYIKRYKSDPITDFVEPRISSSWPDKDKKRKVIFPLVVKCGRV